MLYSFTLAIWAHHLFCLNWEEDIEKLLSPYVCLYLEPIPATQIENSNSNRGTNIFSSLKRKTTNNTFFLLITFLLLVGFLPTFLLSAKHSDNIA